MAQLKVGDRVVIYGYQYWWFRQCPIQLDATIVYIDAFGSDPWVHLEFDDGLENALECRGRSEYRMSQFLHTH